MKRSWKGRAIAAAMAALLAACAADQPTPPPPPISVSLDPNSIIVCTTQTVQFTATVSNSTNGEVTWSLSGAGCSGATCGVISTTGLYTAPEAVPDPGLVTVTATSMADISKSAQASITVLPAINVWTWISGSNSGNQAGIYGTKGVPAASNIPGARIGAVSWADPDGNLWLFGGSGCDISGGQSVLNDLWKYVPTSNQWIWISGSQTHAQPGVYGTKGVPSPENVPGARAMAVSWTDPGGKLWLFGGTGLIADGSHGKLNDLWRFDPATTEWTWIAGSDSLDQPGIYGTKGVPSPTNVPGGRYEAISWVDSSGKLWLFGGWGYDANSDDGDLNDLWSFDPAAQAWTWVSGGDTKKILGNYGTKGVSAPSNMPGARSEAVSWIDAQDRLWLFGGYGWSAVFTYIPGELNDLWRFDPTTLEWTWVSGSDTHGQAGVYGTKGIASPSNVPGARHWALSWADENGLFWLYGGYGFFEASLWYGLLNDLWTFDPATLEWTWVSGSSSDGQAGNYGTQGAVSLTNIPGSRNSGVAWVDSQHRSWILGGHGFFSATQQDGLLNDLWRYDK
jgi:N-acetylneuraminic acid mutarotase